MHKYIVFKLNNWWKHNTNIEYESEKVNYELWDIILGFDIIGIFITNHLIKQL